MLIQNEKNFIKTLHLRRRKKYEKMYTCISKSCITLVKYFMIPFIYRKLFQPSPKKLISLRNKFWIRSIFWDIFWFHSGLWLTLLIIILDKNFFSDIFYATGVLFFWIAHRFSPFYLAWGTHSFRPLCKKQPIRFIFSPLLICVGVFIFIFYIPNHLLPFSVLERILFLFIIDFFWGAHHFAAQHYGILRIYQNFSKNKVSNFVKIEDRIFCWGVSGLIVILAESIHGTSYLQEKNILPLSISNWLFQEIIFLKILGTTFVFGFTIYMIYKALLYKSGYPKILYLLGIGVMVMSAFQLEPFQFLMLWTLQHWLVSVGLASHMGGNDFKKTKRNYLIIFRNPKFIKLSENFIVLLPLCIFSIVVTPFFEIEAVSENRNITKTIFPGLVEWLNESDRFLFFVAIGIATGFLHYWMDRCVYRISDKETSKVAKKLIISR